MAQEALDLMCEELDRAEIVKTMATGVSVDVGELIECKKLLDTRQRHGGQVHMETRADFHTHPRSLSLASLQVDSWRQREKVRTEAALLVVCVDPDFVDQTRRLGPENRATMEAWAAPHTLGDAKKVSIIGQNLLSQFCQISPKILCKPLLSCEALRLQRNCLELRRKAEDQRLLFYYNGHGVPPPTPDGSFYVFQKQPVNGGYPPVRPTYTPINILALENWIGHPCAYVWDCASAMTIVNAFGRAAQARDAEISRIRSVAKAVDIVLPLAKAKPSQVLTTCAHLVNVMAPHAGSKGPNTATLRLAVLPDIYHENIHFAACSVDEQLPTSPELPADLLTACLTTPVKMAMRFWISRNPHTTKVTLDMCSKLPGSLDKRDTPLGELNWIFTSIMETIAWDTMPSELFRKLLRQDTTVGTLFRNFMLADRIMRHYNVQPKCTPEIPQTHQHPLWESLDLEVEMCLRQLPRLLKEEESRKAKEKQATRRRKEQREKMNRSRRHGGHSSALASDGMAVEFEGPQQIKLEIASEFKQWTSRRTSIDYTCAGSRAHGSEEYDSGDDSADESTACSPAPKVGYTSSLYFVNQLRAFDVWLRHAALATSQYTMDGNSDQVPRSLSTTQMPNIEAPSELPVMLQMLLGPRWRTNALVLLYRFLNLGPWAVNLAMLVDVYPYMPKLMSSATTEIQEIMILIWARLVAVDSTIPPELLKNSNHDYFIAYLANNIQFQQHPVSEKVRLSDAISAASAFTLAITCRNVPPSRGSCFEKHLLDYLLPHLLQQDNGTDERASQRVWVMMCLGEFWKGNSKAKWMAMTYASAYQEHMKQRHKQKTWEADRPNEVPARLVRVMSFGTNGGVDPRDAQDLLIHMAFHRSPVVRAAAIYAMGTLLEDPVQLGEDPAVLSIVRKAERQVYALLLQAAEDGSPMVRCEVARVIGSAVFASYMPQAVEAVARTVAEEIREHRRPQLSTETMDAHPEVAMDMLVRLYKALLRLSTDAHPDVSQPAREACDVLMQCYAHSRAFISAETSLDQALRRLEISRAANGQQPILDVVRTPGSSIGDALLGHTSLTAQPQSLKSQMASRIASRSSVMLAGRRRKSDAFVASGSKSPTRNQNTTYSSLGNETRQSILGDAWSPTLPRSPLVTGSTSAASFDSLDRQAPHRPSGPQSCVVSPTEPLPENRFAGFGADERTEAMRRMAEVEQQWQDWGRRELRESICVSTLLDWAGAHFTEFDISLFANVSGPLQDSPALVESRERNRRVDRMETSTRLMSSQAGVMNWTDVRSIGTIPDRASTAILHSLEPHAIVASDNGTVSVFDWEMKAQVGHYSIGPRGRYAEASNIGSLHLINPLGQAKLLVGTRDGKVRIFASHAPDFDPAQSPANFPSPRLLTAFTALPWAPLGVSHTHIQQKPTTVAQNPRLKAHVNGLLPQAASDFIPSFRQGNSDYLASTGSGLVTAWNQRTGILFAGGNDKEVRVWDIATEMCTQEISVAAIDGITCISHDDVSGNLFAVGNPNGLVRVMDRRQDARSGVVANWRDHSPHPVRKVFIRPGQMQVVSASSHGDIKYWDLRQRESLFTLTGTHPGEELQYMVAHKSAPILLTASDTTINFWHESGKNIGVATATERHYSSLASYMKSLAGYQEKRAHQSVRITAAAMHRYLPVALMVSDDGRVSCVQPTTSTNPTTSL
ncbi:Target of rapamycin complex 1 subunit kog1 [Coemansia sp. RSA 552]|nr:Target of rapamycin complex 1 subunit kog1 [Coemansia sp. RSA 552]